MTKQGVTSTQLGLLQCSWVDGSTAGYDNTTAGYDYTTAGYVCATAGYYTQQGTTTPQQGVTSFVRVYLVLIGAHTRQDDVVLLSALEGVHTGHLNVGVQLLPHGAVAQHHLQHVGTLALVRGDHPQLVGGGPTFQEVGHNLLHIGSLCSKPQFGEP